MILRFLFLLFAGLPLVAVEKVDPANPQMLEEKSELIKAEVKNLPIQERKTASQLYRAWVNPIQSVRRPAAQSKTLSVIQPEVRKPMLEPTFSQMKEWKPSKVVQLYEKSKDFDKVLNPLSLRDFNRFIYQRNPSSP